MALWKSCHSILSLNINISIPAWEYSPEPQQMHSNHTKKHAFMNIYGTDTLLRDRKRTEHSNFWTFKEQKQGFKVLNELRARQRAAYKTDCQVSESISNRIFAPNSDNI